MKSPDLLISYNEKLPSEMFDDIKKILSNESCTVIVESRPDEGMFACAEWFLPAAVMAYISKPYFEGFLSEMGKDHYKLLKEKLTTLVNSIAKKQENEPILLVSSEKKLSKNNPFSQAFSFYADTNDGRKFKLLIPKYSVNSNYDSIVKEFLQYLEDYYANRKDLSDIGFDKTVKLASRDIFIHYNEETELIEWLDQRKYKNI
ncbi:MAG: hypothetical protein Q7U64_00010 [Desulfocapsaceae bacterium]|nr:hypothetical protein [Desulfocapsaceae bacterium]